MWRFGRAVRVGREGSRVVNSVLRLNMTLPGLDPERLSEMYAAALDMAEFADVRGFTAVTTDEHHGADNGWMPATLVFTGMLAARTRSIAVSVQALLLPLHDPLPADPVGLVLRVSVRRLAKSQAGGLTVGVEFLEPNALESSVLDLLIQLRRSG